MSESAAASSGAKKRPGRPKKRVQAPRVDSFGIVDAPVDAANAIEIVYSDPLHFKSVFAIFKEYDCSEIVFDLAQDGFVMRARDHSECVDIHVAFAGAKMNVYYCAAPMCIAIKRDNIDIVASTIEKTHYRIDLAIRADDPSIFCITLGNQLYSSRDCYGIEVARPLESPRSDAAKRDLQTYPLSFALDSRHLRRKIAELRKVSQRLVVRKFGSAPLEITFGDSAHITYTGVYDAPEKIKLHSAIADTETFVSTVNIEQIRPLMAITLADSITVYADHSAPMAFQVGFGICTESVRYAIVAQLFICASH